MWFLSCTFTVLSADVTQRSCSALIGGFRIFYVAFKYLFLIQFTCCNNFTYNCLSAPMVIILFSYLFNTCISGRLDSHSLSNRTTSQDVSENLQAGARLHLIVQIPMLYIINEQENSEVVLRQKEYIYCLRRNLISPHVSLLRAFIILHFNLQNRQL